MSNPQNYTPEFDPTSGESGNDTPVSPYQYESNASEPTQVQPSAPYPYAEPAAPGSQYATAQQGYSGTSYPQMQQPVFVQVPNTPTNGLGIAGFVLSIVSVCLFWTGFPGIIACIIGLILSGVGMTRQPKGLAIAGLVVSLIALIPAVFIAIAALQVASTL